MIPTLLVLVGLLSSQTLPPSTIEDQVRALSRDDLVSITSKAEGGDAEAQLLLGVKEILSWREIERAARRGQGLEHPPEWTFREAARAWLAKSAEQGNVYAHYFYARTSQMSDHSPIFDHESRLKHLQAAADQGYTPAMAELGFFFSDPCCKVQRDDELSRKWLTQAAELGETRAMYALGESLSNAGDESGATNWYLKAAQKGHALAQNEMGIRLSEGTGARRNQKEAVEWFRRAAEQGGVFGACNLALHYVRGQGVKKDKVAALMWSFISNSLDGLKCHPVDFLEHLKPTEAEEKEAWNKAVKWLQAHPDFENNFGDRPWLTETTY